MDSSTPSSPLLTPDDKTDAYSTNTLQASFTPVTMANAGDKIVLTGSFQMTATPVAAQGNWFRFGLYDRLGQSLNTATGWLGLTGMGNSLYERTSTGLFSIGTGATQRSPDASPTPISSTSPTGNPAIAFEVTLTRTAAGIVATHRLVRTDSNAILMSYSYTDATPNNNGVLGSDNTGSTGYNPTLNTAGFAFSRNYIGTSSAKAQFLNVQMTYTPALDGSSQTIDFAPIADHTFNDPAFGLSGTATSGLPVSFSVVSGPATVSGTMLTIIGVGTVTVRATQTGSYTWLPAASVDQSFDVVKDTAVVSLGNVNSTFDGDANPVSVTTSPSGLVVNVTYNGSNIVPSAPGSYTVVATVNDPCYEGSATGQMTISAPVFNWTDQTSGADRPWSLPANWSGGTIPSAGVATVLAFFANLTLNSGTVISNQNLAASFVLNALDLNGTGPATGAAMVVVGGQSLSLISNQTYSPVVALSAMAGAGLNYWVSAPISLQGPLTVQGNGTAAFAFSGGITGPGTLTKIGSSTLTLGGNNTFTGATVVGEGCLVLTGTLNGTESLSIASGATLVIVGPGRCIVPGDVNNLGTIRVTNGASIETSGTVFNQGVLDLITADPFIPAGSVNQGIILDAATARQAPNITITPTGVAITIQSYLGHGYKLQYATTLPSSAWIDVGAPQDGTGGALLFTDPAGRGNSRRFYRFLISP